MTLVSIEEKKVVGEYSGLGNRVFFILQGPPGSPGTAGPPGPPGPPGDGIYVVSEIAIPRFWSILLSVESSPRSR